MKHATLWAGLIAIAVVAASCSDGESPTFDSSAYPVVGDFYEPPDPLPTSGAGDLIWVEELPAPGQADAWRVLYQSESIDGVAIAVSGWVAVSPAQGRHRILVVGHGTNGLGDSCAPTARGGPTPFQFQDHLDAGWTIAFTDYQGLGTPGINHYLVSEAAARSLLDVARATRLLDPTASEEVALFGFSQGGHGVLSAAEAAHELAPELEIIATVAVAPAVFLRDWYAEAPPADLGYLGMIAVGYADAYDQPIESWLSPEGLEAVPEIVEGCLFDAQAALGAVGPSALVADVTLGSPQGDALAQNEPGTVRLDAPVLLVTGGRDGLFSPELQPLLVERMCGVGTEVEVLHFPDATHTQLSSLARGPALEWLEGSESDESSCPPAG